ncbi:hypothetical protein NAI54_11465, partial [Francisella tularensis subsp. holarctica]|nr:hypothetical protein [Francisella tularensis subsp. holarctica]
MLKYFKNRQNLIAIVVDEYGAISGLRTIEDVLEEIVGDFEDEFDITSHNIVNLTDDKFILDASTTIEVFYEYFATSI